MKCTELILEDHTLLRRGLAVVDGMLQKLEDGQRIEIYDASTILKFLRLFGDQYHQAMEESVLFPALLRAAPNNAVLREFVTDHGHERILMAQIEEALTAKRGMVFFRSSRELTALLRTHCNSEESILEDLAGRCLSEEQDESVHREFMKARSQVETYADFSRLERRYVPIPDAQLKRGIAASYSR
ncbi:MAG TPA: hemerythrin domain-containing protein [Terriglobia bacterium]|nr:hemerythrin domain-containing protein [Terriglobia bacterium]